MKKSTFIARQGDVLVRKINKLPKGVVRVGTTEKVILAYGEMTGHHHRIESGAVEYQDPETMCSYFEIAEALRDLDHEEHDAIPLTKGFYETILQRGFHNDMVRPVAD